MVNKDLTLPDDIRANLAQAGLLYMLIEKEVEVDQKLSGANRALKEIIQVGEGDLWEVQKKKYTVTRKGALIWENWKARWQDILVNYDVYSGVDLLEGRFAPPQTDYSETDENGDLIWEDLRVAVCLRKAELAKSAGTSTALNPFSMIFLSLLSEGRLDQSTEWQFALAFDSLFWSDIENIVNSLKWPQELGYEGVPWEEVVDDIIKNGMEANQLASKNRDLSNFSTSGDFQTTLSNKEEVLDEYEDEIEEYGYNPEYFYYEPHWTWRNTAMTAGTIGLCWALF